MVSWVCAVLPLLVHVSAHRALETMRALQHLSLRAFCLATIIVRIATVAAIMRFAL